MTPVRTGDSRGSRNVPDPPAKVAGLTVGLTRAQIAKLADDIRGALADPDADLTPDARLR